MKNPESYASVWDAIADTPGESANLRARAGLMRQIAAFVNKQGWTQVEAAQHNANGRFTIATGASASGVPISANSIDIGTTSSPTTVASIPES